MGVGGWGFCTAANRKKVGTNVSSESCKINLYDDGCSRPPTPNPPTFGELINRGGNLCFERVEGGGWRVSLSWNRKRKKDRDVYIIYYKYILLSQYLYVNDLFHTFFITHFWFCHSFPVCSVSSLAARLGCGLGSGLGGGVKRDCDGRVHLSS